MMVEGGAKCAPFRPRVMRHILLHSLPLGLIRGGVISVKGRVYARNRVGVGGG